jgi:hypothetical protein
MMVYPVVVEADFLYCATNFVNQIVYGAFNEGSNFKIMARVVGLDNAVLTVAGTGTCSLSVYDLNSDDPTTAFYANASLSPTPIASLSTASGWSVDSTGYNFSFTVQDSVVFASAAATGGHRYRFEFSVPGSGGGATNGTARVVAIMTCMPIAGT